MNNSELSYQELRNRIAELENQNYFYKLIADNSIDWEVLRNTNGKIIYANIGFERITGYSREEIIEGKFSEKDIVHKDDWAYVLPTIQEAIKQNPVLDLEFRIIRKDKQIRHINLCSIPVYQNNKFVAIRTSARDITEQKKFIELNEVNKSLEISENKFRRYIESSPTAIFLVNANGEYIYVNSAACKLLKYSNEELTKMSIPGILPQWLLNQGYNNFLELKEKGETHNFEIQLKRKDGHLIDVILDGKKISDNEFIAYVKDISERKHLELIMRQNKDRLKILLDLNQITDIDKNKLYDFALEKAIELCNSKIGFLGFLNSDETIVKIHAWSASAMTICEVKDKYIDFEVAKTGIWGEVIRQRKPLIINDFSAENSLKRGTPSGHVEILNYLSVPIFDKGKIVAIIAVGNKNNDYNDTDIQELTLLLDGVWNIVKQRNYEKEIIVAKEKAEESDRLKSAFLQNLSHEIRTPLNAICGFSGLLNKPDLSAEKRNSFVSIIQNSSNQLLAIVSDVLTISSLETRQEKLNIEKVSLNNIILDLLTIFKQQAVNQNISLYAKQQLNNEQSEIFTDKTKITQILSNLISNALKFTHKGFIEFGYELKNCELEFYVKDSGIGIQANVQQKIFERFNQADTTISKKYGGTGLGLAISKGFIELLEGKIWVDSEVNKGSSFYFTIPYKPVNEHITTTNLKQKNNSHTILVAEDEEYNYLFIEELLIDFDYKLIHAKNGQEAIEIFKTSGQEISLILMDIKMPIIDGHTAARIIKKLKPELPIIAQSAYALEQERAKFEGIFDDYLTKPIQNDLLIEIISKYLNIK